MPQQTPRKGLSTDEQRLPSRVPGLVSWARGVRMENAECSGQKQRVPGGSGGEEEGMRGEGPLHASRKSWEVPPLLQSSSTCSLEEKL